MKNDRFLRALRREPVDCTPVWIMRQAGRYLPEYRDTRAKAGSFMGLATNTDYATEVTLQPLERYALDAAILFSDILTVPDAMGLGLSFQIGEGPKFARTVRTEADVATLAVPDMNKLRYVFGAVTSIRRALNGRVPLIGFSGSPWTLAFDHVAGQRPGAAREADQRHTAIERLADRGHGVKHVAQLVHVGHGQLGHIGLGAYRFGKAWAFALGKAQAQAHCIGHGEDVRKQNGRIEWKALQRLQSDFGGVIHMRGQAHKATRFGARGFVFGQVAPSLAHQPQRGVIGGLTAAGTQKGVVDKGGEGGWIHARHCRRLLGPARLPSPPRQRSFATCSNHCYAPPCGVFFGFFIG